VEEQPLLAFAMMLVSIGLVAAILLQSRGAGLGSTFGGDSSVYRSRRGIEKRLFQFTILLGALWVTFALVIYRVAPSTPGT
jgi:preprotein translocase subunit SecG